MLDLSLQIDDSGTLSIDLSSPPPWLKGFKLKFPDGHEEIITLHPDLTPPPPPARLLLELLTDLKVKQNRKPNTIKTYRKRVGQFLTWLDKHPEHNIQAEKSWVAYYASLVERDLSPYTLVGHYNVLRPFARWLAEQGYILDSQPLIGIEPPRPNGKTPPKAITKGHIEKMLAQADTARDKAILLFFRDTGARAMEAIGLTWGQIDIDGGTAQALGKGGQYRPLFFTPATAAALRQYKAGLSKLRPESPFLRGRKGPLDYDGLYKIFKRLATAAGLDSEIFSPHSWRHAFGRDTTLNGIPTAQLQDLMGHKSIGTTKIYIQFDQTDLKLAHAKFSPLSKNGAETPHL